MDKLEYSSDSEDSMVDTVERRKSTKGRQGGSTTKKSEDQYEGMIDMDMSEDSNQEEKPSGSQQPQKKEVNKDVEEKHSKKRQDSSSRRSSNDVKIYDDEFQKERDRRDRHSRRSDKHRDDYRKDQSKERHHKSSRKSKSKKEKKRRHRSRSRSKSRDRESRDSRTNKDNRRSRKRSHSSSTPSPPVANINKDLRPEDSSVRNLNNIVIPSHPPPLMPNYQSRLISAKANIKVQQLEKMGIDILGGAKKADPATIDQIPAYYNKNVINVNKYAEQMEKRKLLWGGKKNAEVKTQAKWENTKFSQDNDGKVASKFMRLMGIKDGAKPTSEPTSSASSGKSTEELFTNMEQQYEKARQVTHTMRGVGLGFSSHARQY